MKSVLFAMLYLYCGWISVTGRASGKDNSLAILALYNCLIINLYMFLEYLYLLSKHVYYYMYTWVHDLGSINYWAEFPAPNWKQSWTFKIYCRKKIPINLFQCKINQKPSNKFQKILHYYDYWGYVGKTTGDEQGLTGDINSEVNSVSVSVDPDSN